MQNVHSCVFRPWAGSPLPGKDKMTTWSLPAWPTPPFRLHICTTPGNLMKFLFLSDKLLRPPLNSNFIVYWGWEGDCLTPPYRLGAPRYMYSESSLRTGVLAQCCVPGCPHHIGGIPRAELLCSPSDRGFPPPPSDCTSFKAVFLQPP